MTIQNKLDELTKFFSKKILNGDFFIEEIEESNCNIFVMDGEDKFEFCVWYSCSKDFVRLYENSPNTIQIEFTKNQKEILYKLFTRLWKEHKKSVLISRKEEIQNEIIKLENTGKSNIKFN